MYCVTNNFKDECFKNKLIWQSDLSTMAILGTKISGRSKEVDVIGK